MTGQSSPGTYTGIEYTLSKDGGQWPEDTDAQFTHGSPLPLTFTTFPMQFPDPSPVTGYTITMKYYEKEIQEIPPPTDDEGNPIGDPTYNVNITYPPWEIINCTMERAEEKFYFENETGKNLFAPAPGPYAQPGVVGDAVAGISDTITGPPNPPAPIDSPPITQQNQYSYCRIFDEADLKWLPRLSSRLQRPLDGKNASIPSEPYFPKGKPTPDGVTILYGQGNPNNITSAGTGYSDADGVFVDTGGNGTGMTVDIRTEGGRITKVKMRNPGKDYNDKDMVVVRGGDNNAILWVQNPEQYPIDAILSFIPDERAIVNITYRLTVDYVGGSDSVIITHPISQDPLSASDKLEGMMERSYFGAPRDPDRSHIGLYPPNEEELYAQGGRIKPGKKLNEPIHTRQLVRNTYPFDLETNTWVEYPENLYPDI